MTPYKYTDGIETERLVMRFIVAEDAVPMTEFFEDEQAVRFLSFILGETPEARAKFAIDFTLKRYAEQRYGLQALIDKHTGEFIGKCGLLLQEVASKKEVEVGYHLLPKYWGKGYAAEAARAFRDYGFNTTGAGHIISIIDPLNEPSKKVARRNGMTRVSEDTPFAGELYNIFRIKREEWEALKK